MKTFIVLLFSFLTIVPFMGISQDSPMDWGCGLDSADVENFNFMLTCNNSPAYIASVSELRKYLPDTTVTVDTTLPIRTLNIRLVIFHEDSTKQKNFDLSNPVHSNFLDSISIDLNRRYSNLAFINEADSTKCNWEGGGNGGLSWTPDGKINVFQDVRVRFRIHDKIEIIDSAMWNRDNKYVCDHRDLARAYFINYAAHNNIKNDAINVYITGSEIGYKRWVLQFDSINLLGFDTVLDGRACAFTPQRDMDVLNGFITDDMFDRWVAKQNGYHCSGGFKADSINACCPAYCPPGWKHDRRGWLHEFGHNFGLGHANQCPQNIQNQNGGGDPRNTLYDLQVAQVNRSVAITNVRNAVYECYPINPDLIISSDRLFDDNSRIYQNMIIKDGATVTVTCELFMQHDAKIIVEQGGKLNLDGGRISSVDNDHCGEGFWRGIEVWGTPGQPQNALTSGIVELKNGAVIERSAHGIRNYHIVSSGPNSGDSIHFGGIIRAVDSKFLNNSYSVNMCNFQNTLATDSLTFVGDLSYFINCDFLVNDDFVIDSVTGSADFNRFIGLSNIGQIKVKGCSFRNETTDFRPNLKGGAGIIAFDASIAVIPKSTSVNAKRSTFYNLHLGVHASGTGSEKTVIVDQSDFDTLDYAIMLSGLNQAEITRNNISVGRIENLGISTAITSFTSTGYHIEGNHIAKAPDMENPAYGIRIFNSGTASNEVYLNTLTEMHLAMIGEAINWNIAEPDQGLEFKCDSMNSNAFDFVVSPSTNYSAAISGIRSSQGASGNSAGNKFDPVGIQSESHYKVAVLNVVNYYQDQVNQPNHTTPVWFNPVPQAQFNQCPSSFEELGGGNPIDTSTNQEAARSANNSEYASLDTAYANLFYNRSQLVDGGSTPQLLADIQASWTGDAWNLRNELLTNSPLSKDAFMEAANIGVLPDALLLEVALANPDATQSGDIIDQLQYEIPNPLDQNAIDLIVANWDQETPLGILEAEMGAIQGRMEVLNSRILRSFLFDPNGYLADSIEHYMTRNMGHSKHMAYINWLTHQERFEDAATELNTLSTKLPEGDYWSEEFDRFEALIDQKEAWHNAGKALNALDVSDKSLLDDWAAYDDLTGAIAKNLLMVNFGEFFYLPEIDLGEGAKRASFTGTTAEQLFQAKVYPNPAESYVSFSFSGTLGEDIALSIIDVNGRRLKQWNIKSKAPVKTISTENLPSGLYYYKAISGEQIIAGKLSIIK
ncbi:T9SS type A sorting domain-containing protein [Hyphobacterium sp. CCMP332]|nr:T9SS type A sorting domain-containing protein [Hyphobacterium sp. CCMP332]